MKTRFPFAILLLLAVAATPAAQTRRPLLTEDPDVLAGGLLEVQLAGEFVDDYLSPTLPERGRLLRAPVLGLNYGVGDRVELQLQVPLLQQFWPTGGDSTSAIGDARLATKLRLLGGASSPFSLAFRAGTKLPNVGDETGIGTDETDVSLELLAGVDAGATTLVASLGLAILGDPRQPASQNDKLIFGLGLVVPISGIALALDAHGLVLGDNGYPSEWTGLIGLAHGLGPARGDLAAGVLFHDQGEALQVQIGLTFQLNLGQ